MKIPVKIVLAEPSVIIRSGISSILKSKSTLNVEIFEVSEIDHLKNTLIYQKPDTLVVNPVFVGSYSLQQIKKETNNLNLKCIAIQTSLIDNASLNVYDDVISIYDSAEQIHEKLVKLTEEPEKDKRRESLSKREIEIIVCVVKGMTNKQIADQLCLSAHTVITHRRNIAAKLEIHSTAGLTIYAIVNKLVALNEIKTFVAENHE